MVIMLEIYVEKLYVYIIIKMITELGKQMKYLYYYIIDIEEMV